MDKCLACWSDVLVGISPSHLIARGLVSVLACSIVPDSMVVLSTGESLEPGRLSESSLGHGLGLCLLGSKGGLHTPSAVPSPD